MKKTFLIVSISLLVSCQSKNENQKSVSFRFEPTEEVYSKLTHKQEDKILTKHIEAKSNEKTISKTYNISYLDSIKTLIIAKNGGHIKDSISYSFTLDEALNTEGNDGQAYYENGNLHSIKLIAYSDYGQSVITYEFIDNKIKVCETEYFYISSTDDIKRIDGQPKQKEFCSYIDKNGKTVGDSIKGNSTGRKLYCHITKRIPTSLSTQLNAELYAQK